MDYDALAELSVEEHAEFMQIVQVEHRRKVASDLSGSSVAMLLDGVGRMSEKIGRLKTREHPDDPHAAACIRALQAYRDMVRGEMHRRVETD